MIPALVIIACLAIAAAVVFATAPEGWEDARGWHRGRPGDGE